MRREVIQQVKHASWEAHFLTHDPGTMRNGIQAKRILVANPFHRPALGAFKHGLHLRDQQRWSEGCGQIDIGPGVQRLPVFLVTITGAHDEEREL